MSEEKKRIRINYLVRMWIVYFSSLLLIFLIFFGIARGWFGYMPSFEELENPERNLASEVYSEDGYLLGTYYIENRSDIDFNTLPKDLINALLATEDVRFRKHSGVDVKALGRVAFCLISESCWRGQYAYTTTCQESFSPWESE